MRGDLSLTVASVVSVTENECDLDTALSDSIDALDADLQWIASDSEKRTDDMIRAQGEVHRNAKLTLYPVLIQVSYHILLWEGSKLVPRNIKWITLRGMSA